MVPSSVDAVSKGFTKDRLDGVSDAAGGAITSGGKRPVKPTNPNLRPTATNRPAAPRQFKAWGRAPASYTHAYRSGWLRRAKIEARLACKLAGCCHKTAANFPHGIRVRGIRDRGSCSQGSASNRSVRPLHCVMHMHTSKLGSGGREKILRRELEQLRRQRAVVVVVGGEGGGDAIPPMQRTCVVPQ